MPTTVVKIGGSALAQAEAVMAQLAGMDVVVVHGGGAEVSAMSACLGLKTRFVEGLRVTDEDTMAVAQMVQARVNQSLVAALGRSGQRSYGLFGQDHGGWLRARVRDPRLGRVGQIVSVDTEALTAPGIPVVAPVAVDQDLRPLNVNADHVAEAIATALNAEQLVFITDVEALQGPTGPVHEVGAEQLAHWIADGTVHGGMLPKARACLDAIARGVRSVSIGTGLQGGTRVWA